MSIFENLEDMFPFFKDIARVNNVLRSQNGLGGKYLCTLHNSPILTSEIVITCNDLNKDTFWKIYLNMDNVCLHNHITSKTHTAYMYIEVIIPDVLRQNI